MVPTDTLTANPVREEAMRRAGLALLAARDEIEERDARNDTDRSAS